VTVPVCDAPVCDTKEAAEAVPGAPRCGAGESSSKAMETIAKTGTRQKAQTNPLEAAGFDKTILLVDDTMKPWSGKKHSVEAQLFLG
jgi:hypothetical protein